MPLTNQHFPVFLEFFLGWVMIAISWQQDDFAFKLFYGVWAVGTLDEGFGDDKPIVFVDAD